MQYVKQGLAAYDGVQLLNAGGAAVLGIIDTDIQVYIRKEGQAVYTLKSLGIGDWVEVASGSYRLLFSPSELDTLGQFRYQILPVVVGDFVPVTDALVVVDTLPQAQPFPPIINSQVDVPPGFSPDPVFQGDPLTISGSNMATVTQVTIGGIVVPILSQTPSQVVVQVLNTVPLGTDIEVVVSNPGGDETGYVDVTLNPADLPGLGMIGLTGQIFSTETGLPLPDASVIGKLLAMPNLEDGVAWSDQPRTVKTDSNGRFNLPMPRNKLIEVFIPLIRYRRVLITPNLATADLFTQIPGFFQ